MQPHTHLCILPMKIQIAFILASECRCWEEPLGQEELFRVLH